MTSTGADGSFYNPSHSVKLLTQISAKDGEHEHTKHADVDWSAQEDVERETPTQVPSNNSDQLETDSDEPAPINFELFSEKAADSELRGLTHWMFYSDGSNVYSYGIVHGSGVAKNVLPNL